MQAPGGTDLTVLGGVLRLGVKDKEGTQDSCGHNSFSRSWLSWLSVSGLGASNPGTWVRVSHKQGQSQWQWPSHLCPSYQMEETDKASMLQ